MGGSVGGIAVVAILVVGAILYRRRKQQKRSPPPNTSPEYRYDRANFAEMDALEKDKAPPPHSPYARPDIAELDSGPDGAAHNLAG